MVYTFLYPRTEAAVKFRSLFAKKAIEWLGEERVGDYGLRLKGTFCGEAFSVVIYFNKKGVSTKLVLEKGGKALKLFLREKLGETGPRLLIPEPHIGVDEAGKGDYFGPLVVAGVFIRPEDVDFLKEIGVADSKKLSDQGVKKIAGELCSYFKDKINLVLINPQKYNELYARINNLNQLLAWGHARVIENLLLRVKCERVIIDQFGKKSFIEAALLKKGRQVKVKQMPRAEEDYAVAAASILARDVFLARLEKLGETYNLKFPKGCGPRIKDVGRSFLAEYGKLELAKVAKLHFRTTQEIVDFL